MADISTLRTGDRIVFSNGHESPVICTIDCDESLLVDFIRENRSCQSLIFSKRDGLAPGTHYEIVKVISNGSN